MLVGGRVVTVYVDPLWTPTDWLTSVLASLTATPAIGSTVTLNSFTSEHLEAVLLMT